MCDPKSSKDLVPQALTDTELQLQADNGPQPLADTGPQPHTDTSPQALAYTGPQPHTDTGPQPLADTGPKPHTDTGPQPLADTGPQPHTDTSPQPLADTGPQPHTDTSPQPQADTGPQPHTDTSPQALAYTGPQPHTDTSPQPLADTGPQPHTDTSPQPQADTGPQPHTDTSPQPQADTGPQPHTDTSPQALAYTGPQPHTDTGPQPLADTGPQPHTDTSPQPQADTGPQPHTDTSPQPQADTGPQPHTDTSPQPQADTGPQPHTDTSLQPRADTGPQPHTDASPQPWADTGPQPHTDTSPQPQADTGPQPHTDTSPQPQADTGPQPHTDTGPQPQADTGPQPHTDTSPQPQADTGPQTKADTDPQLHSDTCSQPQGKMDLVHQANTDPRSPLYADPRPDTESSRARKLDAVLLFAEEDDELAREIQTKMNDIVLEDGQRAKVCLIHHPRFGAVIPDKPSKVKEKCNISFVVLTNNMKSDQKCCYISKEAAMDACLGQEDPESPHVVFPLHTKPKSERDYVIPRGFVSSEHYDWFEPLPNCEEKIKVLFDHYRKPAHLRSGHGSNGTQNQQSSLDGNASDNKVSSAAPEETFQLRRIKEQTRSILEECPSLFCPTRAIRDARETLKKEGSVFLVGRSGDGKTYSAYHILTELKKENPSYEIYIVSKPEDMEHIPPKNSVVFIDNIFGASSFSSVLFEKWRECFRYMEGYVKAGHMYFISASQNHVRDECMSQLDNLPLLAHIIDMSDEYCLSVQEKEAMLTKFLHHYMVTMTEKDKQKAVHSKLTLGFPQCCKMYVTNPEAQAHGSTFFEGSFPFLSNQIKKLKSSETDCDKHLYLVLVMGIFEKGKISFERFDPFSKPSESQITPEVIMQVCGIERKITKDDVVSASHKLCKMGYLRCIEVNALYEFSHQSIYDAVAVIFGKVYTQQIIDLCPLKFLLEHTTVSDGSQVEKMSVITVKSEPLIKRIITELQRGEFSVLGLSALQKEPFVTELFFHELFSQTVKDVLDNFPMAQKLVESYILYFLTASKKYTMFMKRFLEALEKFRKDKSVQDTVCYNQVSAPSKSAKMRDIRNRALHQILEGSCTAGDLIIFGKVFSMKMIEPCQQCILKAADSPVDHPDIMTRLLLKLSLEYGTMERVVISLIEKKRPNTLKRISKSITWNLFRGKMKQKNLFTLACLRGDFEMFRLLTEMIGPPYLKQDLLFPAVNGGNMDILDAIITEDNVNFVDTHGRTILHHACMKRQDLCEFLIKKGIDQEVRDNEGAQAFHRACQYMDEKSISNLINLGLKVTVTVDGNKRLSPLHTAANSDKGASLVGLLLKECSERKDMINFSNTDGLTPLHIASRHPHGRDFIIELMKRKADHSLKDMTGKTALHCAAAEMILSNIVALIDNSANVNAVDNSERTPLHHVLYKSIETRDEMEAQRDSVVHLLKHGADVLLVDKNGNTAMHIAGLCKTPTETLKKLTEKHVSFDLNNDGFSALHLMLTSNASVEFVTQLVEEYPKLLQINTKSGESVLHIALSSFAPYNMFRLLTDKIPCARESVEWKNIKFQALFRYKSEEVICFLEQCAEYFPKPAPADLLHFLCDSNMSDESWTRGMDYLEVDKSSLSRENVQCLLHKIYSSAAKIAYLVEKGANVNAKDTKGNTPLHVSAAQGSHEGVVALLKAGADINLFNDNKETALHMALLGIELDFQNYNPFTIDPMLLFSGVLGAQIHTDMDMWNKHSKLLLEQKFSAPKNDSKSLLELLVEAGGNLDMTTNNGFTSLHFACLSGDNIAVSYLLKCMSPWLANPKEKKCEVMKKSKGVDQIDRENNILFKESNNGMLPIHCAVKSGNLVVVKLVTEAMKAVAGKKLGKHCDTRQIKQTKKHKTTYRYVPVTPRMEGQGKLVRARSQGVSPSMIGSEQLKTCKSQSTPKPGYSDSQQPNLRTTMVTHEKKNKKTLLQYAVQFSTVDIMQVLLKEGWDLNQADEDGNTLLHYAARCNRREVMEYLIKKELDVNCFNKEGLTPLHVATESHYNQRQCIELLLGHGACVTDSTQKERRNLLHLVCKNTPVSLIAYSMHILDVEVKYSLTLMPLPWLLIEKGCDVNGKDVDNMTPLHFAAEANSAELVGILLENNANIDAVDIQGRTPLHIALQNSTDFHPFSRYSAALLLAQQDANPHAIVRCGETPVDILMAMDKSIIKMSEDLQKICQLFKIREEVIPT